MRSWVEECVRGRNWTARAPLLLVLAWLLRGAFMDPPHVALFSGVNLGFHELGHVLLLPWGNRLLTTAGGTLLQLAAPVAAAVYLLKKQRDPFGAAVCLFWLGSALIDAGAYAADARAQALPLVSPFGPVDVDSHDWTVLLMKFGKLSRDQQIGGFLTGMGRLVLVGSLVAGAGVLRLMAGTRSPRHEGPVQLLKAGAEPDAEQRDDDERRIQ